MRRPVLLISTASLLALPACHLDFDERVTGTAIGTGAGILAGGLLGSAVGNTATGAVLGALAGGAAGYIIGDWMADKRERGTSQAQSRDREYGRGRSEAEETVAPVPAPAPAPAPTTFDAIPASGTHAPAATAERAEMARREYEAGRRATDATSALGHYDAASRFDPSRPEPHNARGLVLLYEGKRSEARAAFQRSLAVDPGYAPAAENLKKANASP